MIKRIVIILALIIVAIILWQQNHSNKTIKATANTLKSKIETSINQPNDLSIKKEQTNPVKETPEETKIAYNNIKTKHGADSYTKLYQDYSLAKFCQQASRYDYSLLQINVDNVEPMDYFYDIEDNNNANEQQRETWAHLFQDCEQLAIGYQQDESVISELTELLLSSKAKTDKEKSLKKVFLLVNEFQHIVVITKEKTDLANLKEIKQLKVEIHVVEQEIYTIVSDDSKEEEYFALERVLWQKKSLLKEYILINEKYYNSLLNEYDNIHKQLLFMLKNVEGDTFELILDTINQDRQINKKYNVEIWDDDYLQMVKFDDVVRKYSNNSKYYSILTQPIINLFSCYKGVDCTIESQLSMSYCLGVGEIDRYPQACTKDLQSFLYDDYLSQNQLQDVELIFNRLVNDYD